MEGSKRYLESYKKIAGACRIKGYMYEVKMAGLLFLRLINEKKRFHIAFNMAAAGRFDDLVLGIDDKAVFVQLKHKLGAQISERKRLYTVRRIFAMKGYYSSYCNLKKDWGQKTDLQLWGAFSDVQFVVYTNAVVAEGEAVDTDVQNVLMTGGKCLQFSENDFPELKNEPEFNQFLHQFRFYTQQASEKQLDSLIRNELLRALGMDSQFHTFLANIAKWMEGPGSYLTENVEFWTNIVKCNVDYLNKAKIDQLAKFNLQFDDRELNLFRQQLPEGGGLLSVQNSTSMEAGYKKTDGACRMEGCEYDVKMAGLLFLRLSNERKSFHIASNMDATGEFDDLVLIIDGKAAFVQLKHKLGAQVSERKRTYTVRRIFRIEKLYSSYYNLRYVWGQKTDLQLWGPFSDVQFIVYTNAVVAVGEAVDTDVQNVLITGGKCLRFSENDFPELRNEPEFNQFLLQFRFYTEQASEKKLDSLIRNELIRALGTDSQFQTFLTNITSWMEGPGSYLTENVEFWKDIVKCSVDDLCRGKIDQLSNFDLQFDERELNLFRQQLPEGGGLLRVHNSNALTCLKVHQSVDKKILVDANVLEDKMSEVLTLWGRWPGCDVLAIDGWVEANEKIVHNLGSGKTLVVIDDSENGRELECLSHKDEFRFGQLNEESKRQVLDCKINFQGESIKLNTLVDNTVFNKVANAQIVTQLVSGIAESIGDKLTQQSEHYIPRKFVTRQHVSETIFSDDRDCLVVNGVSLQALRQIVLATKVVEIFDETKHSEEGVCRCYVIGGKEDFEKAKNIFERVHWLHKEQTGFIWKQSKGGVSYIKAHLMDVTSIRSLQEVMLLSDKVKLLVAQPGMGKSTEVVNLAQEFKRRDPACWVVTVVLREHTEYLNKCGDSALELLLRAGKFMSDFAKSLFKHELGHGGNIVILIDGFDEIIPHYTGKVLHMLRQLIIHCKFKQLWITSRSFMKEMLEESFSCLSFELQPFTKQDQRDFLAKLWNDMSDGPYNLDIFIASVLEVTGNSLNDKLGQFTEIPLQTRMLAEVFRSEASHFCQSGEMNIDRKLDLLELYDRFVDRKWNIFVCEKGRVDVINLVQHRILRLQEEEYENDHMACAVHSLLKTEDFNRLQSSKDIIRRVERFQDRFRNGEEKSGIVAQIVNSKAMFIHKTFLDFFAAKWFTKNFKLEREYLKEILFREEFVIVREFFDRILAEGFELHTAILNEDKDYVLKLLSSPECDVNGKDKGGRTPLHLAVINHTESSNFSPNKTVCEIIELLLQNHCDCNVEDEVFHWRPLTLADKIQAWSAVDMLLGSQAESSDMIFTMELIKGEEGDQFLCRLLNIVALQGYVNIAKLMFKCGLCVNHPLEAHFNMNIYPNAITATMLHIASSAGQTKLVEFFLDAEETEGFIKKRTLVWDDNQHHLDTEKTSVYTTTKERLEIRDSDHRTPLFWAAVKGRLETVKMLVSKGANVNTDDAWKQTPLYYAISGCHAEVVKFLIENGANVKVCDEDGDSITFTAFLSDNLHILRQLLNEGGDVNACNKYGESLIYTAVERGNVDFVRLLMDKDADINASNIYGESPVFAAIEGGNVHIVRLLMDKGANVNEWNIYGESPIFVAVVGGSVDIVRLLMDKGADVNARNETGDTPILAAAKGGSVDVVRLLMDKGADVNVRNETGDTPILAAAKGGSVDVVRFLMDKGADVNVRNETGDTPILAAAKGGSVDVVRLLMDKGADVNVRNETGDTPILAAAKGGSVDVVRLLMDKGADNVCNQTGDTPILAAAKGGSVDVVRLLMDKGADVNLRNQTGDTPILATAKGGSVDVVRLLMDKGADVNVRNQTGDTPILAAAKGGSVDVVRLLMDKDADINASNIYGKSPVFAAIEGGNVHIVRLLMDKGANVNECNIYGESPIFVAVVGGSVDIVRLLMDKGADVNARNETGNTPILAAANGGSVDVVRLLMDKGADVNVRNEIGDIPILAAAKGGSVDVVRFLMDKGADVNVRNETGDTPILAAAKGGSVDVVRLLLDKGADVNVRNETGDTPILAAAKGGSVDVVRLLMDKGADVNVRNQTGDTPILAAAKGGSVDVVRLLMDKGADVNVRNETGDTPILAAAKGGSVDVVRLLMDKGADVNVRNQTGDTPILAAAKGGSVDIVRLLMDKGADVDVCDYTGDTPILAAAKGGSVDIVRLLMDKGTDVNVCIETGDTPILAAAKGGSVDIVRLLMDKGADVNVRNQTGDTPILAAAKGGSVDIVRLLMDKGADVDVCNDTGDTPILAAAKGGSVDIVRLLMDKGADVDVCNDTGDTPILAAAKGGSVDIVRLLMDKGADVDVCNDTGDTPILAAAKGGSVDIVRLLMDKGADVDVCNDTGDTPILAAAKGGSVDIVRLLMDKGADVDVCNDTGDTPILAAAKGGSVDIVRLLMDKGGDVDVCNVTGDTPILAAAKGGSVDVVRFLMDKGADVNARNMFGETPILAATERGSVELVRLLMNKGADVNVRNNYGYSPIFAAAKGGSVELVKLLMDKGADVNARNKFGESLIFAASKGGSVDVVKLLMDKGADVNALNKSGECPIFTAV